MFYQLFDLANHGFGWTVAGLAIVQFVTGAFFVLSGMNKLFNSGRHETIKQTLIADHVPAVGFNQWFVPGNEFVGGLALITGILPVFFSTVLAILLSVACICEARERVMAYKPINTADTLDDYLYLPEVIYLIVLVAIAISGGGYHLF